jgi:hypothetical protein
MKLYDSSMAEEVSKTPPVFKGLWLHTTIVKKEISSNGWNPQRIKNSIYGAAIYLSRKKWDLDDLCPSNLDHTSPIDLDTMKSGLKDPKMFVCVLALQDNEVQSCFPSEKAPKGYTGDHVIDYLNLNVPEDKSGPQGIRRANDKDNSSTSLRFSRNAGPGNNRQNKKIADYFLNEGIKAIKFLEHDTEVVAVFDPSCIRVLSEATNFDVHPFSEILAASQVADAGPDLPPDSHPLITGVSPFWLCFEIISQPS